MQQVARRGWLSKIDLLPEEAWPHVKAAYKALGENKRTADAIREELNQHLLALGCEPVSRSSFNRKSLALAKVGADIARAREVAAIFAEKLDEMPEGDVGMLINEMSKVIVYNMTEQISTEDVEVAAKLMKEISLTVYRLEQAGAISARRRNAIEERAKAKAAEVLTAVAKEKGISQATVNEILGRVLGKPEEQKSA